MDKKIAVFGGDRRMALLAGLLRADGYRVCTYGMERYAPPNPASLAEVWDAEIVILPVPLARDGALYGTEGKLPLVELFALLRPEQKLFAGGVKPQEHAMAAERGLTITDYLACEELAVRNAVPTAEGAIELAMRETARTLHGAPCLVLGFGRIGKLLAHRLRGLGAEVSVAARRLDDLAWIDAFGYRGVHTNRLDGKLGEFRVVFNTIPHQVMGEALIGELREDCVLIELASAPGFDRAAVARRGIKCVDAAGLPGKCAPETAAEAIRRTLENLWEESA